MVTIDEVRAAVMADSATMVAERHYDRIAANDGVAGKAINSFLALSRERAMAQAAEIDGMPEPDGLVLAGVPVGIKDVLAMEGAPATAGSKILAGYRPPYDATVVKKLEAAGAVFLGKLNCDEFAMGSSNENSAYGAVRNPRALDRVPGGSSGGSAAAVAAGFCAVSLGTDTGGSIRQPAAFLRRGGRVADVWSGEPVRVDRVRFVAGPGGAVCGMREGCGDRAGGDRRV